MKKIVKIKQTAVSAVAQMLDEAAAIAEDTAIVLRLLHLKEEALRCRAAGLNARRIDVNLRRAARSLLKIADGDPIELLPITAEIETLLFEREQTFSFSRQDKLVRNKRALFNQWRQQAVQIDYLNNRKQAIVQNGVDLEGLDAQINSEQFDACDRRLKAMHRAFCQTWSALRAMDSVLLMHDEEAGLRRLEQIYRSVLPDPDAFEESAWRTEIRTDILREKTDRIISANFFSDPCENPPVAAPNYSETNKRSESHDDHHQESSRQYHEALSEAVCE